MPFPAESIAPNEGTEQSVGETVAAEGPPQSPAAAQDSDRGEPDYSSVLKKLFNTSTAAVESLLKKRRELQKRKDILESKKDGRIMQSPKVAAQSPNGSIDKRLLSSWGNAVVKLNVGGKKVDVRRSTITQIPSRLAWMLSGRWDADLPIDKDGRIFLDFESAWFDPIINHLRELVLHDPSKHITPPRPHEEHECGFHLLLKFFDLDNQFFPIYPPSPISIESKILGEDMWRTLRGMLLESFEDPNVDIDLKLLHRGSADGFSASRYHQMREGIAETSIVTLVKDSTGAVFGGYADAVWVSEDAFVPSSKAFLFSLALRGRSEPSYAKKCSVLVTEQAVRCHPNAHVIFGAGHDLFIADNCNQNAASSVSLGTTYESHGNPYLLTGGSKNFVVAELESWLVLRKALTPVQSSISPKQRIAPEPAQRFEEMLDSLGGLEDFSSLLLQEAVQVHEEFQELERAEADFEDEVAFMSNFIERTQFAVKEEPVLHFNVGGTPFCVSTQTLAKAPDSMLYASYGSGKWEVQAHELDDDSAIFLDLNPYCFGKVLSFLRGSCLIDLVMAHEDPAKPFPYQFHTTVDPTQKESFDRIISYLQVDPNIASMHHQFITTATQTPPILLLLLQEWVSTAAPSWTLLYRGSRDGYSASKFHQMCDGRQYTVVLIRDTNGSIFGEELTKSKSVVTIAGAGSGYTDSAAWSSSEHFTPSARAFLFSLSVQGAEDPSAATKCAVLNSNFAIRNSMALHACFGSTPDLQLVDHCNTNANLCNLGATYESHSTPALLTGGARSFLVQEIEVWQIAVP